MFLFVNLLLTEKDVFIGMQQETFLDEDTAAVEGKKAIDELPGFAKMLNPKIKTIKVEYKE